MDFLLSYAWPGNIRQLENCVERGIALSGSAKEITADHLGMEQMADEEKKESSLVLKDVMESAERKHIENVLKLTGGERNKTSSILGINRKTLWEKMKNYGIGDVTEE